MRPVYFVNYATGLYPLGLSRQGEREPVQTGNIIYRTNRAHGLRCIGKEETADAVEANQCYGPKNSIDS